MSAGIANQIGPFMYADGALRRRTVDGTDYIIGIAGAYNAFGLIGAEHNGIFVLDDTNALVVLDQHKREHTGYFGPSYDQWGELGLIYDLPDDAFISFIKTHPRSRIAAEQED